MADNYLITGYWGEPHVTAENDRGINAAIFGSGRFVLPVGKQFKAEYVGNNTIRLHDGKLLDNGAAAGIPAGMYIDFQIPGAGQGLNRNDVIAFQYTKDTSTFVESGKFVLISGTEISGTAADPVLTQNDLLTDEAVSDQMALWRIPVSGAVIGTPERMAPIHYAGDRVVTAHSTDGVTYTADVPGVIDLYNGMELTIIPDKGSTSSAVKLNVNGTGDKLVRLPLSFNTAAMTTPDLTTFFVEGRAVKLMYDSEYAAGGIWKTIDKQKTSAQDLYGTVPIASGGTGATTAEAALQELGLIAKIGDTITISTNQCYTGYVSSDSKAITFSVPLPKWLPSNVSGVTINSVKLNIRKVAGGYIGGSSSFVSGGFEYVGNSNYTVSAEVSAACRHMILVTLTNKAAKMDVVNNTPVSLVGLITFKVN